MSKPVFLNRPLRSVIIVVCIVLIDVFVLSYSWTLSGEVDEASEYEVKAAFILNFIRFIDWSDKTKGEIDNEIILGIAGENRFGEALNLIRGKKVKGRVVVVNGFEDSNNLTDCDILFISSSEKDRLSSIMAPLKGLPILTVSEIEGFAQRGGIINFIIVANKIRFEINPDVANQVGIQISSQLLKLARIVTND